MALWRLTIKQSGTINTVRIEKGMSIELATNSSTSPLQVITYKETIAQLFKNKYGIDVLKACAVNPGRMSCERIG
jgi:hypothetical protein